MDWDWKLFLILCVLFWAYFTLSCRLRLLTARMKPSDQPEVAPKVAEETCVGPLSTYAGALHSEANRILFVEILRAFEEEAASYGFEFLKNGIGSEVSPEIKQALGSVVMQAKRRHCQPRLAPKLNEQWTRDAVEDGAAEAWADTIIRSLQTQGVVMVQTTQSKQANAKLDAWIDPVRLRESRG